MKIWTRSSYENIFRDCEPAHSDTNHYKLVMAQNEYESFQILMRHDMPFTILKVDFEDLINSDAKISASNLRYNYVQYEYLFKNSEGQTPETVVRVAPDYFPEALSNDPAIDVGANETQPIWITVYVPKDTPGGIYSGKITISTSQGIFTSKLNVEVNEVCIPDSCDGRFNFMHHQQITGAWWLESTKNYHPNDPITMIYGYERWTNEWWEVVNDIAELMRECRMNFLYVNIPQLLLDGGTTLMDNGQYVFNWSKVDEYIEFFMNKGVVKCLEGTHIASIDYSIMHFTTYLLKRNSKREMHVATSPANTEESENWLRQYLPALQAHIEEKGWLPIWYQHVGDEAMNDDQLSQYTYYYNKLRQFAPKLKIGDPVTHVDFAQHLIELGCDVVVPIQSAYDENREVFEKAKASGITVYLYNCSSPGGSWLNRFVDKPVWNMRSLIYLLYQWGIDGYLHWGFNFWFDWNQRYYLKISDERIKGDHYSIHPDFNRNKVRSSIRMVACRDACEDYELLAILGDKNPEKAKEIARKIGSDSKKNYITDINEMLKIREELVREAAKA